MNEQPAIELELLEKLRGMTPSGLTVTADTPLNTIGLDSIRMVELLIFIEKKYGAELLSMGLGPEQMATARTLAGFIAENIPGET